MLTWSFVLDRIKDELGLPFQQLERSDEEIVDYLKRNAVKKYSLYFPAKRRLYLDTTDSNYQVPNRTGEYFLVEPDNRTILNIVELYQNMSSSLILGHPWIGVFNYDSIPDYALDVHKANTTRLFSIYDYTHEFIPPNIIRITPKYTGDCTVEYECEIDPELTDIRPDMEDYFIELCVAMFMRQIGRIRRKFSNIATPFGEIQLNAEEIFSEGEQRYNEIIEKFESGTLLNVIFDRG